MTHKYFLLPILGLAYIWPLGTADAATLVCSGKVDILSYHADDQLMLKLDSMNVAVFFCSPERKWTVPGTGYATGPETCKMLYSTFMAAKMADQPIFSMYFDGDQVPASCNDWASWKSANIRHYSM
jgi:hypothetical protein